MKKTILTFLSLCIFLVTQATPVAPTTITVVSTAGGLATAIATAGGDLSTVTNLTVTGNIDARDFKTMRDSMTTLQSLDIENVRILGFAGGTDVLGHGSGCFHNDTIPDYSFYQMSSLSSVILPKNIKMLNLGAFSYCTNLDSILIPDSVGVVGSECFMGCSNLKKVKLSSSISEIGAKAFLGCVSLSDLSSLYSVERIYSIAFGNCSSLNSFIFPQSVSLISNLSLMGCSALSSIYSKSVIPADLSLQPNVFGGVDTTTCILYVPKGSKAAYQAADQWKAFQNIVEMDDNTASANDASLANVKAVVKQGKLELSGLDAKADVAVYNMQGIELASAKTTDGALSIDLPARGVYAVRVGKQSIKVLY